MPDPEIVELRRKWGIVIDVLLVLSTPVAAWLYLILYPDILQDLRERPHLLRSPVFLVPFLAAIGAVVTAVLRFVRGATWRRRLLWFVLVAIALCGWPWACGQVTPNYSRDRMF